MYLEPNRVAQGEIHVNIPVGFVDALWPMFGWLTGLESSFISQDDLKSLCADPKELNSLTLSLVWHKFNATKTQVELIAIGSPSLYFPQWLSSDYAH